MLFKNSFRYFMMLAFFCGIAACQTLDQNAGPQPGFTAYYADPVTHYLDLASTAAAPQKQNFELKAAGRLLQDHSFAKAQELLTRIEVGRLPNNLKYEKWLMTANMAALQQQGQVCLNALGKITEPNQLLPEQKIAYYQLLASGNTLMSRFWESAQARIALDPLLNTETARRENRQAILADLDRLPTVTLTKKMQNTPFGPLQGWLDLVYINRLYANDPTVFAQERRQWQLNYPQHPANMLFTAQKEYVPPKSLNASPSQQNHPLKIALLLPNSGDLSSSAKAITNGFMAAKQNAQKTFNVPVTVETYNTSGAQLPTLYKQAVSNGANIVVGPLTKSDVEMLEKSVSLTVPTLGLNFTNNKAKSTKNLYQYALSPQDEAYQVAKKMISDGRKNIVMMTPAGAWGQSIATAFDHSFTTMGGKVIDRLAYSGNLNNLDKSIKKLLRVSDEDRNRKKTTQAEDDTPKTPIRRQDVDAIFLVATPQEARQIKPLLSFYYAGDLPVYATSHVYSGTPNPLRDKDLNGILFCDTPWMLKQNADIMKAKQLMHSGNPPTPAQKTRLFAFGYDAFQIATRLSPFTLSQGYIQGTTGALYLNDHQVYRQLEWAQFRNGLPKPIN